MVKLAVRKNAYYDSVTLMLISKDLKKMDGVREALVGMGTELNLEIARNIGLVTPELDGGVTGNDFFVAIDCENDEAFLAAQDRVEELLSKKTDQQAVAYSPPTLEGALLQDPALNMALISVPGKFAAEVAQGCLDRGIHVMLFSDNVTVEEEKALKDYAAPRGLLVMGPDCGTAIINDVPLAFANVTPRGGIGMVCASGTGAQEVCSLIAQFGCGVSQLIGTGGRDLKREIGGVMMRQGLEALIDDPDTKVIVLVSKPPAKEVASIILAVAAGANKPVVVCFIGGDRAEIESKGLVAAASLEDAAYKAVALLRGEPVTDFTGFTMGGEAAEALACGIVENMAEGQRYVRGLYTGGTLCDEAMKLMAGSLGHIYSNIPLRAEDRLENARFGKSRAHTCLDFGDDEFTVGRPHPMIDPSLRAERVLAEGADPETAVILCDCVIGYGSHEDPAADLAEAITHAKAGAEKEGRHLCCVCAVCGTEGDPQRLSVTRKKLMDAGAVVLPSNAQAARFALLVLEKCRRGGNGDE